RRVMLHRLDGLAEYARMLEDDPVELEALYQDVLISVTSFFRNPEAFESLREQVFPRLVENRPRNTAIRIWVQGCSTGEEAYSIAIALTEYLEARDRMFPLQVFATDVNGVAIDKARVGIFPKGIAQDVSAERLRRFFSEVD